MARHLAGFALCSLRTMKPIILLGIDPSTYPDGAVETTGRLAPNYELLVTTDQEDIEAALDRIEIALVRFSRELIPRAPALRWFQQGGAGADWLARHPEIADSEVIITNASGVHSVPISEHILALLLGLGRGFRASILGHKDRVWHENRNQNLFELAGKRCLLLGVGAIGGRFAKLAAACEMEVVGVRRNPNECPSGVKRMIGPGALREELGEADFIVNTLPLTPETRHMLGRREIELVKPGAYIVNIGRGATIDEQAMIDALRSGRLGGAGLDVFETEPLPEDSPLWDMENVIVTPHYSGLTPRYNERVFEIFSDNLQRYLSGQALRNVVDKQLQY